MKALNVTLTFRVMISRATMRDPQPPQGTQEAGGSEFRSGIGREVKSAPRLPTGNGSSTNCSTAAEASSVRHPFDKSQPTMSRF